jgi:predicted amidophosphoribosyltransferase
MVITTRPICCAQNVPPAATKKRFEMSSYKQPCLHCNSFIERDSRFCPVCGNPNPFTFNCPACLKEIHKKQLICSGCGRHLYIACPICGKQTFVQEKCEQCGAGLMVKCQNRRCEVMQFFENTKCTACGKKIKK